MPNNNMTAPARVNGLKQAKAPEAPKGDEAAREPVQRVPMGTPRQKLALKVPKGFTARWVKSHPDRIAQALAGGYRFLTNDGHRVDENENVGARISQRGGSDEEGPYQLFAMVIPTELYEQDQAEKQREVDHRDNQIRRGDYEKKPGDGRIEASIPIAMGEVTGSADGS